MIEWKVIDTIKQNKTTNKIHVFRIFNVFNQYLYFIISYKFTKTIRIYINIPSSMNEVLLVIFYRRRNWGSEKLSNTCRVTITHNYRHEIPSQVSLSANRMPLTCYILTEEFSRLKTCWWELDRYSLLDYTRGKNT